MSLKCAGILAFVAFGGFLDEGFEGTVVEGGLIAALTFAAAAAKWLRR